MKHQLIEQSMMDRTIHEQSTTSGVTATQIGTYKKIMEKI